jgi:hypothetical protein
MHLITTRELLMQMEETTQTWLLSDGEPITRATRGMGAEAYGVADGTLYYFYVKEPIHDNGFTVYKFTKSDASAVSVSHWGQFYNEGYAEEICMAFARGRIDEQTVRNAFKARKARTLDGVMMYKRNQARKGNIAEWRSDQKKRVIPRKPDEAIPFLTLYITQQLPKAAALSLALALASEFKTEVQTHLAD